MSDFPREREFVLTIGNFDGCHVGHQALIKAAKQLASADNGSAAAPQQQADICLLTFEPRPAVFFARQRGLPADDHAPVSGSLFAVEQKVMAMRELGVDHLILQTFDTTFSRITPEAFFDQATTGKCRAVVVGDDFHFGADRRGDTGFLKDACARKKIAFVKVPGVTVGGVRASSSTIRRELIDAGDVDLASRLLGREYAIDGKIEKGAQNGRRIGVRTANLRALDQVIPKNGVYAGFYLRLSEDDQMGDQPSSGQERASLISRDPEALPCVINIGYRPTVDSGVHPRLTVEAHIIDYAVPDDALYGTSARIYFAARLRDERKFDSLEALKSQIQQDIGAARKIVWGSP